MGRRVAAETEVAWRRHETRTKDPVPEPVGDDTSRQRIFRIGNPFRKSSAPVPLPRAVVTEIGVEHGEGGKSARLERISGRLLGLTASQQPHLGDLRFGDDRVDLWRGDEGGELLRDFPALALQSGESLPFGARHIPRRMRLDPRIAEANLIVPDPVAPVSGDESEKARRLRQNEIDVLEPVFSPEPDEFELHFSIEVKAGIGVVGALLPEIGELRGEAHRIRSRRLAQRREVKGDAGIGVQPQQRMTVFREVDPARDRRMLARDRAVPNEIPGLPRGLRQTAYSEAGRANRNDSLAAESVGDKNAVDELVFRGSEMIRLHLGEPAEVLRLHARVAGIEALTLRAGARAVASTDNVREVEPLTLEPSDLEIEFVALFCQGGFCAFVFFQFGIVHGPLVALHPGEDGPELVIFLLTDRVELVIVAAGAIHRHAHGGGHHLGGHVVEIEPAGGAAQLVAPRLDLPDEIPRPRREESGRDDRLGLIGPEDVAGDLLFQKPVVGFVLVEGIDDIIPITPGRVAALVAFKAVGVGVMRDVEPVPRKALAEMGRREETVDELFIGRRIRVGDKSLDRFGRRRHPVQVKGESPDERTAIRLRRHREPCLGETTLNKDIDGMPALPFHDRLARIRERLPGPVGKALVGSRRRIGPGSTGVDPGLQNADLG